MEKLNLKSSRKRKKESLKAFYKRDPIEFMKEEHWRRIRNFLDYSVSNWGRVWSYKTEKFLKPCPDHEGYLQVGLYKDRSRYSKKIHKLVIEAFVGPCPEGKEANHISGIKANCRLDNLEYLTHSENLKHAFKMGLMNNEGENGPNAKLNMIKAREIRKLRRQGMSCKNLTKRFRIGYQTIYNIINNEAWQE